MFIDVIIPTFNRASVLEKAINSVLKQTHKNFKLIIVDDGSTDNTADILKQYSNHPQVEILRQDNRGVSAARNMAIKHSKAEWISFLDSDDEWLPHKLSTQVAFIKANPQYSFVHSEETWVRNGVRVNPKIKHKKSNENLFLRSLEFCLISPSTVLMKRDLCLAKGCFDQTFEVCEDYDLWLKILATEEIGFIEDSLAIKYGGHEDQLSTKFFAMDYWRIKSLVNLFLNLKINDEKREQVKNVIAKKSDILLKGYQKHGNQQAFTEISSLVKDIISYS